MKRAWIHRFLKSEQANILMLTGLSILFLVALGGAGLDFGRQQLVRSRLQQATDAAALAAAALPDSATPGQRQNAALRVFQMNFPSNYLGVSRPTPSINAAGVITVEANGQVATNFVSNVGTNTLNAQGRTVVSAQTSGIAQQYDVVLSFDHSGSMCSPPNTTNPNCNRNIGNRRIDAVRTSANNFTDKILTGTPDNRIAANSWSSRRIGLTTFTSSNSVIKNFITNLNPQSGQFTDSSVGMTDAYDTMSTQSRPDVVRAVILLTDGRNTTFNGVLNATAEAQSNTETLRQCNRLKQLNPPVVIYTIAFSFEVQNVPSVRSLLSNCASGSPPSNSNVYFFEAPTAQALNDAFNSIGTSVKKLRIQE